MTAPYPLLFRPILLEKVWGGRRLERYGKALPDGAMIGESWELADLAVTSPTGAGGGAARSVIANGELAGRTIGEAMELWGAALLGVASGADGFPLLVKYLDARENLSVQVHPSAAYAAAHPECHVKSECWYVLEAEPGAVIYKGLRAGVTRERFEACVRDGGGAGVVDCLEAVEAVPGECHDLPSGTCHALGAGVLVAEVQTPSDTTFRVHDWGRAGRGLHVEQALACIEFGPAPAAKRCPPEGQSWEELARTDGFSINHARITEEEQTIRMGRRPTPDVLMVLRGRATMEAFGRTLDLTPGTTVLVPAGVMRFTLTPLDGGAVEYLNISLRA